MIVISNLCKSFGKKEILHNISMEIRKGEVFGLIGPNGAGKTTLMKSMCGFLQFESGEITVSGTKVSESKNAICKKVGVLIESTGAYEKLSGYKNLKIVAELYDNVTEEDIERVIDIVDLKDAIHKKYKTYSLGMKQRLGIAMALLNNPEILILDEPTNGIDFDGVRDMRALIEYLAKKKQITIVVSSHILGEMDKICDRAAFIKDGTVVKIVEKEEIEDVGFEEEYIRLIGNEVKNYEVH